MTNTPPSHTVDHVFLVNMFEVLERTQNITPKPDRAELIKLLQPLRDQLVNLAGSPEELQAASTQMRHHLEQFAATSLGSPEAQQIIQLTDPNAAARILAGSSQRMGGTSTFDELLELPRGRGVLAGDVADRIGPGLRRACGVTAADDPATVRRKVANRLAELCERLPVDLRISVLAALALHPMANHQFMQDRMMWAALQINRDHPRAAVRRMKVGFRILAEQFDGLVDDIRLRQGWHTSSLRALLRMDVDPPQLIEDRVIVAADDLTEIEIRLSAPGGSQPEATILYGGEITHAERVTRSHTKFTVRLPTPLRAGEKHQYGVRFTAFPRAIMPPFYVLTPLQPCEHCTVRVQFGKDIPTRIWRLDGIPPRAIDDFEPPDRLLTPNGLGEVALEFAQLHQGLSYGIRWATERKPAVHQAIAESH
jgi:hypothetical protein